MNRTADVVVVGAGSSARAPRTTSPRRAPGGPRPRARRSLAAGSTGACAGGFRFQFSSAINVRLSQASVPMITGFTEEHGLPARRRAGRLPVPGPGRGAVARLPRGERAARVAGRRGRGPHAGGGGLARAGDRDRGPGRGDVRPEGRDRRPRPGSRRGTPRSRGARAPRSSSASRSRTFGPTATGCWGSTRRRPGRCRRRRQRRGSVGGGPGRDGGRRPAARADPSARPGHRAVRRGARTADAGDRAPDQLLLPSRGRRGADGDGRGVRACSFETTTDETFIAEELLPTALRIFPPLEGGLGGALVGRAVRDDPDRHPIIGEAPGVRGSTSRTASAVTVSSTPRWSASSSRS